MYYVLTVVFGIVVSVLTLSIIIGAFRQSVGQGLLCLFVPLYALVFAFGKWTFSKRALVGGGQLLATVGLAICVVMSIKTATADALEALQHPSPAAAQQGSTSTSPAGASAAKLPIAATCSVSYPSRGLAVCTELHGASVPAGALEKCKGDEGVFATGSAPCAPAGATGKCEHGSEVDFYYAAAVGDPKSSCELLGNTWTAMTPAAVPASATAPAAAAKPAAPAKPAATPKAKGHK